MSVEFYVHAFYLSQVEVKEQTRKWIGHNNKSAAIKNLQKKCNLKIRTVCVIYGAQALGRWTTGRRTIGW